MKKILNKSNFNIDKKFEKGLTALYAGIIHILRLTSFYFVSPLFLASSKGHTEIVSMLLSKKAKVNLKLKDGCTALYAASKNGHAEIVDLLLRNNAEVNVKTENGWTPLYDGKLIKILELFFILILFLLKASQEGHVKIVELLLRNNADVNVKLKDGCTALYAGRCLF